MIVNFLRILLFFCFLLNTIIQINCELKLTILHTNDMHSRILETSQTTSACDTPGSCYGGFARVAYEAKRLKSNIPNAIFLNAGDSYQGSPLYSIFKWKVLLPLMNMLGIDVMSLGNHEFDDGIDGLVPYLQQIRIPVVTCNLDTTDEPSLVDHTALKPWHMLNVEDVRIGVIGYLTPDTKFVSSTGDLKILDEVKSITKYAKEAKEAGAQLIFAVGHSGYLKDQEIAKNVPDVDVVVGGHTDTFLYTGSPPDIEVPADVYPMMVEQPSGKKVPVVQAYGYTKYLGKLDLVWDDDLHLKSATGNPILLDSSIPKDILVEQEVLSWASRLNGSLSVDTGKSKVLLDGNCRLKECNFGNFIADAFIYYGVTQHTGVGWTDAPITILNGGFIRTSVAPKDHLKWGDLLTVLPFANQVVKLKMKGSILLKALERSVERYDLTRKTGSGEFLQVSGIQVEYVQNPDGKLVIKKALARCGKCTVPIFEAIDPHKEYFVLSTVFLAHGGDGYNMIKNDATIEKIYDKIDLNIVADYIQHNSPVFPSEERRIILPEKLFVPPSKSSSNSLSYNLYIICFVTLLNFILYNN